MRVTLLDGFEGGLSPEKTNPMVLLLHDNELSQVGLLLKELGVDYVERQGNPTDVDQRVNWSLIIASQKRVNLFDGNDKMENARRIAIIENDSRTLRAMLRRLGVDYVVARPVHAAALRLLILHCLYRGPERRNQTRVSVGAQIQYRSGFFKRDAILADLSLRGCRLVSDKPAKAGSKIRIIIPIEISTGKQFSLSGNVLRTTENHSCELGQSIAIAFYGLSTTQGQHLRRVCESYASGPAKLLGTTSDLLVGGVNSPVEEPDPDRAGAERRIGPRKGFDRRIVSLNDEAARVLLCRDISLGGMRVESNDSLVPGDDLLIAVHAKARTEPLVVSARVTRDDGPNGLILEFHDLSNENEVNLRNMVERLPSNETSDETESDPVVSEIVERLAS
jgi:c-di-GMP-binding flagellar brake protein YcgR